MITVVVNFGLLEGMKAEEAREIFESSAPRYKKVPGLVRKYYLCDTESGVGGGVYLWKDRELAEALYDEGWRETIRQRFGSEPKLTWFDTPVVVDNA